MLCAIFIKVVNLWWQGFRNCILDFTSRKSNFTIFFVIAPYTCTFLFFFVFICRTSLSIFTSYYYNDHIKHDWNLKPWNNNRQICHLWWRARYDISRMKTTSLLSVLISILVHPTDRARFIHGVNSSYKWCRLFLFK